MQLMDLCRRYGGADAATVTSAFCYNVDSRGFDVLAETIDVNLDDPQKQKQMVVFFSFC